MTIHKKLTINVIESHGFDFVHIEHINLACFISQAQIGIQDFAGVGPRPTVAMNQIRAWPNFQGGANMYFLFFFLLHILYLPWDNSVY